jgi:hypothetical protein
MTTATPFALQIVAHEADVCAYCTRSAVMGQEDRQWLAIELLTSSVAGPVQVWTAPQDRTKLELRRATVCPACVEKLYELAFGPLDDAIEVAKKSLRKASQKEGTSRDEDWAAAEAMPYPYRSP